MPITRQQILRHLMRPPPTPSAWASNTKFTRRDKARFGGLFYSPRSGFVRQFGLRRFRRLAAPPSGGTVLALIRPDETPEQHATLHARIAAQAVDARAFAILFVRASPGTHRCFR